MKDKINVAELLKDCPKGMELDCTMFENVYLERVDKNVEYPIVIRTGKTDYKRLTKEGCWNKYSNAKCVIFPKGKTTWEGFVPPCLFKEGDIIFTRTSGYAWVSIFKQFGRGVCRTYIDLCIDDNDWFIDTRCLCSIEEITTQRFATEEEKAKLFQAIKDNGYRWNEKTKTLEKLVEPKFKVGDRIVHKENRKTPFVITEITKQSYKGGTQFEVLIEQQDNFELVPNKYDITNLKPFESRVLVRDYDSRIWIPTFWGKYLEGSQDCSYLTTNGCYKYCIPYDDNQELLGTTNDCDEFYKTWK